MTEQEKFLFDLWGYVVIENVLSADEVTSANVATDHHQITNRPAGLAQNSSALKAESGRGEFQRNPLTFEHPYCQPFRHMLVHPKVISILNEILGVGFRLDHGPGLIQMEKGTEGHWLHGGMTFDPSQYHHFSHGRMSCGLCVAAWQLTDVQPGDGGFACIPGSHKSNYRPPQPVVSLQNDLGCVHQVVAPAGSVIIFNEALVHGTLPWTRTDRFRRSILFKYSPGFLSWGSPHTKCPITDPTPEESALYEPPRRTGRTAIGQA